MAETNEVRADRSAIGKVALAGAALSALGLVVSIIGSVLDLEGFSDSTTDNSAASDAAWLAFSLGGLIALVAGIVAWIVGARSGRRGDVKAGQIALGYLVLAVVITFAYDTLFN